MGGSKVSSKIGVLEALMDKCDKILVGGGMIFTFYKARGLAVGKSLVEEDKLELAKARGQGQAKVWNCCPPMWCWPTTSLPTPTARPLCDRHPRRLDGPGHRSRLRQGVPERPCGLSTVIWNGPMGVFEFDKFAAGTNAIATTLADLSGKGCCTIIGGGDSVAAVEKAGLADKMSHISTGGGASRELLEGKVLPGVAALDAA